MFEVIVIILKNITKKVCCLNTFRSILISNKKLIFSGLINTRLFKRDINTQYNSIDSQQQQEQQQQRTLERTRLESIGSSKESMLLPSTSRMSSFRLTQKFIPYFENLRVNRLIRDSNVLVFADGNSWDWEIVTTMLRVISQ